MRVQYQTEKANN